MRIPAYIIANGDNEDFFKLQTSPIGGISNIERLIISLKNSHYINEIIVITNSDDLDKFISQFEVKKLLFNSYTCGTSKKFISKSILSEIDKINKSDNVLIVNAKYPLLSTFEVNKVINEISKESILSFSSINNNHDSSLINSYLKNNNKKKSFDTIIDLQSLYFIRNFSNWKDKSSSKKYNLNNVNISWSYPQLLNNSNDLTKSRRLFQSIEFPKKNAIDSKKLKFIFLDFDGVLTDNYLFSDKNGNEIIRTTKYDSYSIVRLKKEFDIQPFIISSELSDTHKKRAEKIDIPIMQSKTSKDKLVRKILEDNGINHTIKEPLSPKTIFIGNDLNDLSVLPVIDLFCCPSDSHPEVLSKSEYILETKGGCGVVKELLQLLKKNL